MTSKELVLSALRNEETARTPWVPFVGCHAATILGMTADRYLRRSDYIVEGFTRARELYRPDGMPVLFDLQVEAEALGCELRWSEDNPPSVVSHPLEEGADLSDLEIPSASAGRLPMVLEAARTICSRHSDMAVYGLVTGPFTLALHLMGSGIFLDMFDRPDRVKEVMSFTSKVAESTAKLYADAGVDVIALVDPMTSQISPAQFAEFVSPYVEGAIQQIHRLGKASSLFVCGDARRNIEAMCKCKPMNIAVDENIDLAYMRDTCRDYGVSFGGNIPLTTVLLFGSVEDSHRAAWDCMSIGGTRGYILSPGCDIPFGTPVENIQAVAEVVHGEWIPDNRNSARLRCSVSEISGQVAVFDGPTTDGLGDGSEPSVSDSVELSAAKLPDYSRSPKVIVDLFTLDSEACAPCQYMVEAVQRALPELADKVEWKEHKIKTRESVALMKTLGVTKIPTIAIDGEPVFESIIPDRNQLVSAIEARLARKGAVSS